VQKAQRNMAGVEKISIPLLGSDNWSIWKDKFEALLEFKDLTSAIAEPESDEGKKANGQARALMTLYIQDAHVKLIRGERSAVKAWKKLEDTFQKSTNARVIQLRKKLTIVEYLANARELQLDLEMTGQTVSDMEVAVHVLNGLLQEYATLIEVLESGESGLNLDAIQPKLIKREEKLKLEEEKKKELEEERERDSEFLEDRPNWPSPQEEDIHVDFKRIEAASAVEKLDISRRIVRSFMRIARILD
jgi:hypothetical protein